METDGCFHSSTVEQVTVNLDQANYFSGDSLKYRTSYVSSLWRGKRNEYAGSLKLKKNVIPFYFSLKELAINMREG